MPDLLQQEACRGCRQACVSACEQDIIRIHPEGHALAGIPWLDFSRNGCTFCGECAAACPLEHVRVAAPALGGVQLVQERCLSWHDVICLACSSACQLRALVPDRHRRMSVNADRCNGCGMCISVCPVDALAVCQDRGYDTRSGLDTRNDVPF
jgi:ferredoxin-type protein NapF